jgi:hypothetical protein
MDRSQYLFDQRRARFLALSFGDRVQPAARAGCARARSLWHLHVVPGSVSDRCPRRTIRP